MNYRSTPGVPGGAVTSSAALASITGLPAGMIRASISIHAQDMIRYHPDHACRHQRADDLTGICRSASDICAT